MRTFKNVVEEELFVKRSYSTTHFLDAVAAGAAAGAAGAAAAASAVRLSVLSCTYTGAQKRNL